MDFGVAWDFLESLNHVVVGLRREEVLVIRKCVYFRRITSISELLT